MKFSRRQFLQLGGSTALATSVGCDSTISEQLWPYTGGPHQVGSSFFSPSSESIDLISHHLNRLTFGPRPSAEIQKQFFQKTNERRLSDYERVSSLGETTEEAIEAYIKEQLQPDKIDDSFCDFYLQCFETLVLPRGELFEYQEKLLLTELTCATLMRSVLSERQLQEVMIQFWTDHFNIDQSKGDCRWLKAWDDREVIRKHALGKFPELLRASALSPAMLWYLDGRKNVKENQEDRPNENYARELLELHTLGVHGGYTQDDVEQVARCLTGWRVQGRKSGNFYASDIGKVGFRKDLHDDGEKKILGRVVPAGLGKEDLDRVLDIVSQHPSTAKHIATKLCMRFIADEPPQDAVSTVAASFQRSGGDICRTLQTLFQTGQFQDNKGNKFKRPFNFLVSSLRATGATINRTNDSWHLDRHPLGKYLLRMGDAPFQYPTPDGYPQEISPWLGTLLWRWDFALKLSQNEIKGIKIDKQQQQEENVGGADQLIAHFLGRRATDAEQEAYGESGNGLALLLASPAFQMC